MMVSWYYKTANLIDDLLAFVTAVKRIRQNRFEARVTSRMWYYRGVYDWVETPGNNSHGVYLRLNNGKYRLVRIFATSAEARYYLRHKSQKYVDERSAHDKLYAESPEYKYREYKAFVRDRYQDN